MVTAQAANNHSLDQPFKPSERNPLNDLLFAGMDKNLLGRLEAILGRDLFSTSNGLTPRDSARLSYERARMIAHEVPELVLADPRPLFAMHELLGPVDGTCGTVLSIHYCLALGSIASMGNGREELRPIVDQLRRFDAIGVFLATELAHGNDVMNLETTATYDKLAQEFVIDSPSARSHKFMPNTAFPVGKIAIVLARLLTEGRDCGVFPFIVPLRDSSGKLLPGVRVTPLTDKPGYALDNGITAFESVRVPKAYLLSGPDSFLGDDGKFVSSIPSRRVRFLASMDRVQTGRVCFTSSSAAFLRTATWIAIRYGRKRTTTSPNGSSVPLILLRNVQKDLYGSLAESYALTLAVRSLQDRFATEGSRRGSFTRIAVLKAVVSSRVGQALSRLRERCGAVGLLSANRIADYWVQNQGIITAEGDNQLMLLKAGRQLLDESDEGVPRCPFFDVRDPASWVELTRYRQARLKQTLKKAVASSRARSRNSFEIWNDNLNRLMEFSTSWGELVLAEEFKAALSRITEPEHQRALRSLYHLWSLTELKRHSDWYLSEGCIDAHLCQEIPDAIDAALGRLDRFEAILIDGLGVNNLLIRAPIADDYIEHYAASTYADSEQSPPFSTTRPLDERPRPDRSAL